MIDHQGDLFFSESNQDFQYLPKLESSHVVDHALFYRLYFLLNDALKPQHDRVHVLTYDEIQGWCIELQEGTKIVLGRKAFWPRIKRFKQYWPSINKQAKKHYHIDMRYRHGFAVSAQD